MFLRLAVAPLRAGDTTKIMAALVENEPLHANVKSEDPFTLIGGPSSKAPENHLHGQTARSYIPGDEGS
jgi:hypothetical protein